MTSPIRRTAAVVGLAAGLVATTVVPAAAAFSASASVPAFSMATATVAAPGNVQAAVVLCSDNDYLDIYTGSISWSPSDARDVSGYTVRRHLPNGSSEVVSRSAATATRATHLQFATGRSYVYSVTTETAYGWTAQSGLTAPITC